MYLYILNCKENQEKPEFFSKEIKDKTYKINIGDLNIEFDYFLKKNNNEYQEMWISKKPINDEFYKKILRIKDSNKIDTNIFKENLENILRICDQSFDFQLELKNNNSLN